MTILNNDKVYEAYMGSMGLKFQRVTQQRVAWIAKSIYGDDILDIGCSQGILDLLLGREDKRVTALDIDKTSIDFANELLKKEDPTVQKNISFLVENFTQYETSKKFSSVIFGEILEHNLYPEHFISKAYDLLIEKGHLVVTLPFGKNEYFDHKHTYYLADFFELVKGKFLVKDIAYIGKWICFCCEKQQRGSDQQISFEHMKKFEEAIANIETQYIDTNIELKKKIEDLKNDTDLVLSTNTQALVALHKEISELQISLKNKENDINELLKDQTAVIARVTVERDHAIHEFLEMNSACYETKNENNYLKNKWFIRLFLRAQSIFRRIIYFGLPGIKPQETHSLRSTLEIFNRTIQGIPQDEKYYLLITNNYPSPNALYSNMFVHSRVAYYKEKGLKVLVFVINESSIASREDFEGIPVFRGNKQFLKYFIQNLDISKFLVHFLNQEIHEVISSYKKETIVWLHGAEIHSWRRRIFNYPIKSIADFRIVWHYIRQSKERERFFKALLTKECTYTFIVISEWFKNDIAKDLGINVNRFIVIPNYINSEEFPFIRKDALLRKNILSIRPFASRSYANDLTIKTILAISRRPFFNELHFTLVGSGPLYDKIVQPIRHLKNVTLINHFLRHDEISELHRRNGVFLCPTRMDTQGVSLGEALASGLVGVSTKVAAIPEFLNDNFAYLAPPENYKLMAKYIEEIYYSPEIFLKKSELGSQKMLTKCNAEMTVNREIELILQTPNQREILVGEVKIALISDEFTYNNLHGRAKLRLLTTKNFRKLAKWCDLLLIESAWQGNGGIWEGKISNAGTRDNHIIKEIISYYKDLGIKTVFWNKEDPFHFESFVDTAVACDYVFTTDSSIQEEYLRRGCRNVFVQPFFFNPELFNPITNITREDKVVYAGCYYGAKFPERKQFMDNMVSNFKEFGLTIYDRNIMTQNPDYDFPNEFQKYIKGALPPTEIFKAYKGYRVNINTNSITTSRTMFARRVVEIMACNSALISSDSASMKELFPFIVSSNDNRVIRQEVSRLFNDDHYYRVKKLEGLREVFKNYTTDSALYRMLFKIGMPIKLFRPLIGITVIDSKDEVLINELLKKQTYSRYILQKENSAADIVGTVTMKHLNDFHLLEDVTNAYKYLHFEDIVTKSPAHDEYTYIDAANSKCSFSHANMTNQRKVFNINHN